MLNVSDLKKICDAIGKMGKPITETEIKEWPSVVVQNLTDNEVAALVAVPQGKGLYLRTEIDGSTTMAMGFVLLNQSGIEQVEQTGRLTTDRDCRYQRYSLSEAIEDLPYYWQAI